MPIHSCWIQSQGLRLAIAVTALASIVGQGEGLHPMNPLAGCARTMSVRSRWLTHPRSFVLLISPADIGGGKGHYPGVALGAMGRRRGSSDGEFGQGVRHGTSGRGRGEGGPSHRRDSYDGRRSSGGRTRRDGIIPSGQGGGFRRGEGSVGGQSRKGGVYGGRRETFETRRNVDDSGRVHRESSNGRGGRGTYRGERKFVGSGRSSDGRGRKSGRGGAYAGDVSRFDSGQRAGTLGGARRSSSREWSTEGNDDHSFKNNMDYDYDSSLSLGDEAEGEEIDPMYKPASGWMKDELSTFQGQSSAEEQLEEVNSNVDNVYGINPVLNALQSNRREVLMLYVQDGLNPANKKDRAAADQIHDIVRENDITTTIMDKGYLNTLCGNRPHQGFVLKAKPLTFEPIICLDGPEEGDIAEGTSGESVGTDSRAEQVWLALDEVTDPQNFGALLRSAHFFGATGVVVCSKNSASLTATVSKASAGAMETMTVHSTKNMMRFLKSSRENGWRIIGTAISERSTALEEIEPRAAPTIVVLGNEGYGLRTNVVRECDVLVEIEKFSSPGATSSTVDSLNVSVTGGVMLFHLLSGKARSP
ncbi:unnamed protein product [Choristocarpus tenellus]